MPLLRAAAATLSEAVLRYTGDTLTLIDPQGAETPTTMLMSRIGVSINPGTGMMVQGDQTALTFTMPASEMPTEDWRVRFIDSTGTEVDGKFTKIIPDRSLNRVTGMVRVS